MAWHTDVHTGWNSVDVEREKANWFGFGGYWSECIGHENPQVAQM
jgi:hypothetical protein